MAGKANASNEPKEWKEGQRKGREARQLVAEQLSAVLVDRDMTGSESTAIERVREVAEAKKTKDRTLLRASVFEAAAAFAAWAVDLDLASK